VARLLRDFHAADREERQAQGIGDEKGPARCRPEPHIPQRDRGSRQDHPQVRWIGDPEDRVPVEQQVAQRSSAYGRYHRNHCCAEHVQALAAGGQHAADGEYRDSHQIENVAHQALFTEGIVLSAAVPWHLPRGMRPQETVIALVRPGWRA